MTLCKHGTVRFPESILREKLFYIYVSLSGFIKKAHKDSEPRRLCKAISPLFTAQKASRPKSPLLSSPTLAFSLTICGSD